MYGREENDDDGDGEEEEEILNTDTNAVASVLIHTHTHTRVKIYSTCIPDNQIKKKPICSEAIPKPIPTTIFIV